MTNARVESFLADVFALEGPDAIREGVHVALADCAQIFRAQEVNRRMKDKAAHACHALCALALSRKYSVAGERHCANGLTVSGDINNRVDDCARDNSKRV